MVTGCSHKFGADDTVYVLSPKGRLTTLTAADRHAWELCGQMGWNNSGYTVFCYDCAVEKGLIW